MELTGSRNRLSALYQLLQMYHKELYTAAAFGIESCFCLLKKRYCMHFMTEYAQVEYAKCTGKACLTTHACRLPNATSHFSILFLLRRC